MVDFTLFQQAGLLIADKIQRGDDYQSVTEALATAVAAERNFISAKEALNRAQHDLKHLILDQRGVRTNVVIDDADKTSSGAEAGISALPAI